jgi:hypothetical protein
MSKNIYFISDFFLDELEGGAEFVDQTIINFLGCKKIKSCEFEKKIDGFLILSNTSKMSQETLNYISKNYDYIIIEHDYKIHVTRQPWRFKNSIIPNDQRINYNLYKNAKAVFVQTNDHLKVFKDNDVPGKFISLDCSIWAKEELEKLSSLSVEAKDTHKFAIVDSTNFIKNKVGAEEFCQSFKIDYSLIPKLPYFDFLKKLSRYPALVFFPIARETCCRLIVEARCLNMNVITNNNSGAFMSDWYKLHGIDLINHLFDQSKINLEKIKNTIYDN